MGLVSGRPAQVWTMPVELKRLRGLAKEDESDDAPGAEG